MGRIVCGDCLKVMAGMTEKSVDLVVTSPPYNTSRGVQSERAMRNLERRYAGFDDDKGVDEYIEWTLERFEEFNRVLKDDGCVCYNVSYGSESADKSGLMWLMVAEVLRSGLFDVADCIVWKKRNCIPNNVSPNKMSRICEFVFVFCKKGHFDTFHANKEKSVVSDRGQQFYSGAFQNLISAKNNDGYGTETHKATYSVSLVYQLLDRYGVRGGVVMDPFLGTGTTAIAAIEWGMDFIGCEISEEYAAIAEKRIKERLNEPTLF